MLPFWLKPVALYMLLLYLVLPWPVIIAIVLFYVARYFWELVTVENLENKAVFITGCDSGFGRSLALKCSKNGVPVFAGCYLTKSIKELEDETANFKSKLIGVYLDVTNDKSVTDAAEFVNGHLTKGKKLWALINNAGYLSVYGPDEWTSIDQYKLAMDVNTYGMIRCVHAFLPLLKKSKGRIISMSSCSGRVPQPFGGPYSISKFAVEAYMDDIRNELRPWGITCSILEPGAFLTGLIDLKAMQTRMDVTWNSLTPELREEYGEKYKNEFISGWYDELQYIASPKIQYVVDNYYHAITAKYPRCRYFCGYDAVFYYIPLSFIPAELQDKIGTFFRDAGANSLPSALEKKKYD